MKLPYQLIRSNRRTLSIAIRGAGALVVHAPMRMPLGEIEAFLAQKQKWIEDKQRLQLEREAVCTGFSLTNGAMLPYQGGALRVCLCSVPMGIDFHGCLLLPAADPAPAARAWLRRRSGEVLAARVAHWAAQTGLKPEAFGIGMARRRWGSMSSKRSMRLNAALLMCPPELADYVIVHELAHIVHPNHSPAFHALVASILPDAAERRARLTEMCALTRLLNEPPKEAI